MNAEEIRALKPQGNLFDFIVKMLIEIAAQIAELNERLARQSAPQPRYETRQGRKK